MLYQRVAFDLIILRVYRGLLLVALSGHSTAQFLNRDSWIYSSSTFQASTLTPQKLHNHASSHPTTIHITVSYHHSGFILFMCQYPRTQISGEMSLHGALLASVNMTSAKATETMFDGVIATSHHLQLVPSTSQRINNQSIMLANEAGCVKHHHQLSG